MDMELITQSKDLYTLLISAEECIYKLSVFYNRNKRYPPSIPFNGKRTRKRYREILTKTIVIDMDGELDFCFVTDFPIAQLFSSVFIRNSLLIL